MQTISLSDGTVNTDQGKHYHSIQVAVNLVDLGYNTCKGRNEHLIIERVHLIMIPEEGVPGPGPNAPVLDALVLKNFVRFQIRASDVVIEGFVTRTSAVVIELMMVMKTITFRYNSSMISGKTASISLTTRSILQSHMIG